MTEATKPARTPEGRQLAEGLVERARDEGVNLVGPGGLLTGLVKNVLEVGLEAEMLEHFGCYKHDPQVVSGVRTRATAHALRRC